MKGAILGAVVSLALSSVSLPARAYVTFDAVVPDSLVAGETVFARVGSGFCDFVVEQEGYPQITQAGNTIRMVIYTFQYYDPILCFSDPGTWDAPIGSFPLGSYSIQLDRYIVPMLGSPFIETIGTRTFVVSGSVSEPVALPMLSLGSLLLIALGFLGIAGMALARRQITR